MTGKTAIRRRMIEGRRWAARARSNFDGAARTDDRDRYLGAAMALDAASAELAQAAEDIRRALDGKGAAQ
jgi:hypothetical protein